MKKYIIASIASLLLVSFLVTQLTFAQTTTTTSATTTKVIKKHAVKPVVKKPIEKKHVVKKETKQNTYSACVGKEISALTKEMKQKKINALKEYQKALKEINAWYKNAVKEAKEKCKATTTPATSTEATSTATTSTTTP
jgi:glucose-6-phosphate isomerase